MTLSTSLTTRNCMILATNNSKQLPIYAVSRVYTYLFFVCFDSSNILVTLQFMIDSLQQLLHLIMKTQYIIYSISRTSQYGKGVQDENYTFLSACKFSCILIKCQV